ncbi:MAG TPA: LuxR C-terminal-related transcriptional regulator [Nitrososphaera sp.]|nr:LuxR C-terminal-related transcriptional regulator [Nitrososphaera sp.]
MGKKRILHASNEKIELVPDNLDGRDQEILSLLLAGRSNREIASSLRIPMSTVQRRTRNLFERDIIRSKYELNHKKLGFRKGLLHVYLKDGNIQGIAEQVSKIYGMQSTSIHIGNSDIVGLFVFKETQHLLNIMSSCKKIEGVEKVVWSEEVVSVPGVPKVEKINQLLPEA